MAAILSVGEGTVACAECAADLWQIWRGATPQPQVLVTGHPRPRPGVELVPASNLEDRDLTLRYGIPITTLSRTLLDLSARHSASRVAAAAHEAQFRHDLQLGALRETADRNPNHPGIAGFRRVIELISEGETGTWSKLEEQFLSASRAAGLPDPRLNMVLTLPSGDRPRPDFVWLEHKVIVETDGWGHKRVRSIREDKRRDRAYRKAGFRVIRCGPHDIEETTERVARIVPSAPKIPAYRD